MNPIIKQFTRRIIFFISDALLYDLDVVSKKKGWKRSMVIREAIKEYLYGEEPLEKNIEAINCKAGEEKL